MRSDGTGGSLTIFATFAKWQGTLTLVRSDRLLAQLPSPLVGVGGFASAVSGLMQVNVTGRINTAFTWRAYSTAYAPMNFAA
jgi:hypothetical protein